MFVRYVSEGNISHLKQVIDKIRDTWTFPSILRITLHASIIHRNKEIFSYLLKELDYNFGNYLDGLLFDNLNPESREHIQKDVLPNIDCILEFVRCEKDKIRLAYLPNIEFVDESMDEKIAEILYIMLKNSTIKEEKIQYNKHAPLTMAILEHHKEKLL